MTSRPKTDHTLPPIHFVSKQVPVTDALRDYTHKRFERLKQHTKKIVEINVTFTVFAKQTHEAKARLELELTRRKITVNAKMESEDLYKSIDGLVDKLDNQLKKIHDKKNEFS